MILIKPMYTIKELAKLIGYSANGCRQFFLRNKVPLHLNGNRYFLYLSDLQDYMPDLYRSILEANNLKSLAEQEKTEQHEVEDLASKDQFRSH